MQTAHSRGRFALWAPGSILPEMTGDEKVIEPALTAEWSVGLQRLSRCSQSEVLAIQSSPSMATGVDFVTCGLPFI